MRWLALGMAALALAGCARTPRPTPIPTGNGIASESISYETGPCFGSCPVFRVVVASDGTGTFTGIRNTAVSGERKFKLTAGQYAAFRDRLLPYMPQGSRQDIRPGTPLCRQVATDLPSVEVNRTQAMRGAVQSHLYLYFGCDMDKNRAMADALGNAPDVLPIGELIGERP